MEKPYTVDDDCLIIHLDEELDHHLTEQIRGTIDSIIEGKRIRYIIMDFENRGFMDSSGIGLIIGRAQTAGGMSCSVRVIGLSPSLYKLVRLTGLEKMKNITVAPPTAV